MKKAPAKRRTLNDTVADLIKTGKLTQQELDESRAEALQAPEWQIVSPSKSASQLN